MTFKNYFKIAVRHILKNKLYTFLNVAGLVVGLTCFFLIYLYVQYEYSYDKNFSNSSQIYRIVAKNNRVYLGSDIMNATPGPLAPFLKENFPEVLNTTRIRKTERLVQYEMNTGIENRFLYVDREFLDMFMVKFLKGNSNQALNKPNSIILTKSTAQKYFGDNDPTGKNINIDENKVYEITGVIEDAPANSHIQYDFLTSINSELQDYYNWYSSNFKTYIQVEPHANISELEKRISRSTAEFRGRGGNRPYIIQSIRDIHLKGNYNLELEKNGSIVQVRSFLIIGIFILLIACFNYINLATADGMNRMKELSVKKIIGAKKSQLIFQIIGESTVYILVATLAAIFLVKICLPFLNSFLNKEIQFSFLFNIRVLSGIFLSIIATCLFSGLIPAIYINQINPLQIVKQGSKGSKNNFVNLRNSFVISQFIISILLIIGAICVHKQLRYVNNKNLGYQTNNILTVYLDDHKCRATYPTLKTELLRNPGVQDVTVSSSLLNNITGSSSSVLEGKENNDIAFYQVKVDPNFFNFYGISIKQGAFFPESAILNSNFYILNETAEKVWDSSELIGKGFELGGVEFEQGNIVGVVPDFHFQSLHINIAPLAIANIREQDYHQMASYLSIKINPQRLDQTIKDIEGLIKQFSPNYPFVYSFLDSNIKNSYKSEANFQNLIQLFCILAIVIACMGLIGLANYNLKNRINEIGVRKVNGAKISEILTLLNQDFVKWVVIAFIIAAPIAHYIMNKWLEDFAYKTDMSWWIFASAGISVLGIALLTVSWQSWKAATRNPVEALRYE